MAINGIPSPEDYIAAHRLSLRPRPRLAVVGLFIIAGALWAAVVSGDWVPLIPLALLGIAHFLYVPNKIRRAFRQNADLSEPVSLRQRDNGILFTSAQGEKLIPWSAFRKWRSNQQIIVIYGAAKLRLIVPRRFFGA